MQGQSAEVVQLARENGYGNPAGEAHRDRVRDVTDQHAQPRQAEQRQQDTRDKDSRQQTSDPVLHHRRRDQHDERARRSANLEA